MSESRWIKAQRQGPRLAVPVPTKRNLSCPACHGHTVQRDVSREDTWYVEYCVGGKVQVTRMIGERTITESEPCEYWGAGFEQKRN